MARMHRATRRNAALMEQQAQGGSDTMRLFRLVRGEVSLAQTDAVALRLENRLLVSQPALSTMAWEHPNTDYIYRIDQIALRKPAA